MVALIGLMIGVYINLRAFSFMTRTGERQEPLLVRLMAGATILMNWGFMYALFNPQLFELPR